MNDYKDLSELLESDSRAMAFYNTLPIGLQQKMYKGGVGAFTQLFECADRGNLNTGEKDCLLSSASVNECTGLVPTGENSNDFRANYCDLEPFGIAEAKENF